MIRPVCHFISGIEPPGSWPDKGQIELDDISVRYASDLDPVLKGVTLTIPEKEKVAIPLISFVCLCVCVCSCTLFF